MRAFVTIFPPPEVRESLLQAARNLSAQGNIRWSRPGNVHLTLKFLGEVPEEDLDGVRDVLARVCARHEPFGAETSGFGAFPSARKARVVWASIGEGHDRLRSLAEDLERSLEDIGFAREGRAYTPHVALGRIRGHPARLELPESSAQGLKFPVREVELVRSVLGESGAAYSTLVAYPLSESGDQGS
ncbi:RNA 2',3'-cyclic phosphodiesterase [soil metagenome]